MTCAHFKNWEAGFFVAVFAVRLVDPFVTGLRPGRLQLKLNAIRKRAYYSFRERRAIKARSHSYDLTNSYTRFSYRKSCAWPNRLVDSLGCNKKPACSCHTASRAFVEDFCSERGRTSEFSGLLLDVP